MNACVQHAQHNPPRRVIVFELFPKQQEAARDGIPVHGEMSRLSSLGVPAAAGLRSEPPPPVMLV